MGNQGRRSSVENRARLLEVASQQAGLFTARQAEEAGYARPNHVRHQVTGEWERVLPGIYRLAGWSFERSEHLVLWSLWSGGVGVVSHESAAEFYGIGVLQAYAVNLTVPSGFGRQAPASSPWGPPPVLHRADVAEPDRHRQRGFTVTSPLRTIFDLATTEVDGDHLTRTIADGLSRQLFDRYSLERRARLLDAGPGAQHVMEALGALSSAEVGLG